MLWGGPGTDSPAIEGFHFMTETASQSAHTGVGGTRFLRTAARRSAEAPARPTTRLLPIVGGVILFAGYAGSAPARDVYFYFHNDGSDGRIHAYGDLDLTGHNYKGTHSIASDQKYIYMVYTGDNLSLIDKGTDPSVDDYDGIGISVSGGGSYRGAKSKAVTAHSYASDFYFEIDTEGVIKVEAKSKSGREYSFAGGTASFDGSLSTRLGDDNFRFEYSFTTNGEAQRVIFTTTRPALKPRKSTGFRATADAANVSMAWDRSTSHIPISSYEYRHKKATDDGWPTQWKTAANTGKNADSHEVALSALGLEAGLIYDFQIRARNGEGAGAESGSAAVWVPLAAPTGVTTVAGDGEVTLNWSDPSNSEISLYQYRFDGNDDGDFEDTGDRDWTDIPGSAAGTASYKVTGLTNDSRYGFQVRAVIAPSGGDRRFGSASATVKQTPHVGPGKPGGFELNPGAGQVTLRWDDQSDDSVHSGIGKWQFREGVDSNDDTIAWTAWTDIPIPSGASARDMTSYVRTGRTNDTRYSYVLRAVSAAGSAGAAAGPLSATPEAVPATVSLTSAEPGAASVTLTWVDPENPAIDRFEYRHQRGSDPYGDWIPIPGSDHETTSYTVTGLENGQEYRFQIQARTAGGAPGRGYNSLTATPNLVPPQPVIVGAVPKDRSAEITVSAPPYDEITSWQARHKIKGDDGFGSFGSWASATEAADPENAANRILTVASLANGETYIVQVRAWNGAVVGPASTESPEVMPHERPDTPSLSTVAGDGRVYLHWTKPRNVDVSYLSRYEYRQRADDDDNWGDWSPIPVEPSTVGEYRVTGLENDTTYQFQIRAVTAGFEGRASDAASGTPGRAPATPALGDLQPGSQRVTLVWSYTANDVTVARWQYRQREGNSVWGYWTGMTGSDANARDHTVAGLENGKTYEFRIRAVSVADVVGDQSEAKAATPVAPPGKPAKPSAQAGDMQVTLAWTDPGNADIEKYQYEKNEDGAWEDMSGSGATTTSYTVTGLSNGTAYTFRIRAVTAGGAGPESDASDVATPDVRPGMPQGLRLEPGNSSVTLTWNDQSADAASIRKWQYIEKVGDAPWPAAWTDIPNSVRGTTEHTVTGLANDTVYGYRIRAAATGDKVGPASDARFATPAGEPAAAVLAAATAGTQRVMLSWTLDPADPSILRWQYQQRMREGQAAWPGWTDMWNPIPDSGAATRKHLLEGLTGGVEHEFRVRAVGYGGDGAPSNEAAVTPEAGPSAEAERRVVKRSIAAVAQATLSGATDTIGMRFDAAPGARSLTLVGRQLGGDGLPETGTAMADDAARDRFRRWDDDRSTTGQGIDSEDLLWRSAFVLSLAGEEAGADGRDWTVWGRGDWRSFEGSRDGDGWYGKQRTGWLGADARLNPRLTAGLAVSRGDSEADYRLEEFEGRLDTSVTALWPYFQVATDSGGTLQLVLGAGTGDVRHRKFDGTEEKEGLSLLAGSVSGRMPLARMGAASLSALAGASLAEIETDGSSSTSSIGGLTAGNWSLRGGLKAEHDGFELASGSGWLFRPLGALALRQDGGDGVTGTGMEVSGGVRLTSPGSRFGLDASGHWLALHTEDRKREMGASLEARLAPAADGRGLSLSVGPAWGQQRIGALQRERPFEAQRGEDAPQRMSLTARTAYGFEAAGGLVTPFADMSLVDESSARRYRTGIGFVRGGIDAALTAGHRSGGEAVTRVGVDLRLRY